MTTFQRGDIVAITPDKPTHRYTVVDGPDRDGCYVLNDPNGFYCLVKASRLLSTNTEWGKTPIKEQLSDLRQAVDAELPGIIERIEALEARINHPSNMVERIAALETRAALDHEGLSRVERRADNHGGRISALEVWKAS